jgi:hypothetical protein
VVSILREGWHDEDYLLLLSDQESSDASRGYRIQQYIPGYQILGLRSWDDFIVRDAGGGIFTVPTVPMDRQYLATWKLPAESALLTADLRFTGRIKWYTKPLVFGGGANDPANTLWVSREQHMQLVTWWNARYREARVGSGDA